MNSEMLDAVLNVLPCGVIVVDSDSRIIAWNPPAEEFIACVERPTLYRGMTMSDAHPEAAHPAVESVIGRLAAGGSTPSKTVCAKDGSGRTFHVSYRPLHDPQGAYLGVAQVIEGGR